MNGINIMILIFYLEREVVREEKDILMMELVIKIDAGMSDDCFENDKS